MAKKRRRRRENGENGEKKAVVVLGVVDGLGAVFFYFLIYLCCV